MRLDTATIIPLYTPRKATPMQVAGFSSGTGSNLTRLFEEQNRLALLRGNPPYRISAVFTDNNNEGNNARKIAGSFGVEFFLEDYKRFCEKQGSTDEKVREEYFRRIGKIMTALLRPIDCIVLAGFMMRIPKTPLLEKYDGRVLNVHPGDFAVRTVDGKVKYTGSHAVRKAILDRALELRSTVHLVTPDVDQGPALVRSPPVQVVLPDGVALSNLMEDPVLADKVAEQNQSRLKKVGDLLIYPKALELMADGRFGRDKEGNIYLDGKRIPIGGVDVRDLARA
jgi:folate-dependent phosphoribosylglycinamide formyltransferase PurN